MNPINMIHQLCNAKYINGAVVIIITNTKDPGRNVK